MMLTNEEILEAVGDMTVFEFQDFITQFTTRFAVTVRAPEPPPAVITENVAQDAFSVVLVEPGPKKIEVIKAVRELTKFGLKEAKQATETPEFVVRADVSRSDAEAVRDRLVAAGAVVVIR